MEISDPRPSPWVEKNGDTILSNYLNVRRMLVDSLSDSSVATAFCINLLEVEDLNKSKTE